MGQESGPNPDKWYFVSMTCYDSQDSSCTGGSTPYYRNQCLAGYMIIARGGFDGCFSSSECSSDGSTHYILGPYDDYPSCAINEN